MNLLVLLRRIRRFATSNLPRRFTSKDISYVARWRRKLISNACNHRVSSMVFILAQKRLLWRMSPSGQADDAVVLDEGLGSTYNTL